MPFAPCPYRKCRQAQCWVAREEKITEQEWEYNTLSLPETHTQQGWTSENDRLGPSGGYTTEAEYDELGLTVANEYSNNRRLEHSYDGLNRLQKTDDDTNLVTVANYLYSGSRLIERKYGNNIKTTYEYESSGCGCGGFSGLVENVEHEDGSGQTLFQTERRYDTLGNVTAERRAHQGNYGEVHRFDDAYRLTKEYWGAWLGSTNLDTYADPANTPTTFSFQREYSLDTRGNRTEVEDFDSSSNSLRSVSYSPDADTNVYDSVDGQTFSFDDMEQMTHDPTTGLYHAYDYKGQLTESDDDSDFSSPERRYFYDTNGRMRIQERWYNPMVDATFSVYPPEGMAGGCGGTQQLTATEHLQFDGASFSAPASVTQRVVGKRSGGNGVLAETVDKTNNGTIDEWHYHHEDQLGTLRGMTDADGNRIAEIDTSKYGDPYCKHILFDGRPSRVDEAVVSDEENEITEITTLNGYAFPEEVEGAVLRAADANGAYTAIVTSVDGNSILIDDPNFDVLDAVAAGADFVIFDNRMGSVSGGANLGGTWDGAVYNMSEDTSLIDADDAFDSYFTGWHVQVDASLPVYFEILDANGDEIKVSGDVTGMITAGETNFMIIHPVGVDPETGATQEDPCVPESRYIWGGGLYLPPVAGFETMTGVEGAQPGSNMSGQHYMWNRVYDINTSRWTTPDPAAQPWWNLQGYGGTGGRTRRPDLFAKLPHPGAASGSHTGGIDLDRAKVWASHNWPDSESCGEWSQPYIYKGDLTILSYSEVLEVWKTFGGNEEDELADALEAIYNHMYAASLSRMRNSIHIDGIVPWGDLGVQLPLGYGSREVMAAWMNELVLDMLKGQAARGKSPCDNNCEAGQCVFDAQLAAWAVEDVKLTVDWGIAVGGNFRFETRDGVTYRVHEREFTLSIKLAVTLVFELSCDCEGGGV